MLKHIAFFAVGAIPAAALTWNFVGGSEPEAESSVAVGAPPAVGSSGPSVADSPDAALTAFGDAGELDDPADLDAALSRALAEPFSLERDARIAALFKRLATLDVRRALRFSALPGFDAGLVADVFLAWAESDRDAALGALAAIGDPRTRLDVAIALVGRLGNDLAAIEEIALALPAHQRIDFTADAIAARVAGDPDGALAMALGLRDPAARNTATQRVGIAWTGEDPVAAMALTDTLPRELQGGYRDAVSVEWVRIDTSGFLSFLDTQPTLDTLRFAMIEAMAIDPERLFEISARHPPVPLGDGFPVQITVERTAFSAALQREPERMVAFVEALPESQRKNMLLGAVADTWGRTDPAAAREWAKNRRQTNPGLESTVVWSAAIIDIDMAVQWMLDYEVDSGQPPPPLALINLSTFIANDANRVEIANRLRARTDDPVAAELLRRSTAQWVQSDPAGALEWMLEGGSAIDPAMVAGVASRLASRDAELAASYISRMPAEVRGAWLEQVAVPYVRQHPEDAATWISQFQGEANYERLMQQLVLVSAQTDPQNAARMLQFAPAGLQAQSARTIAATWVREDIAGAARWAVNVADQQARTNAVRTVADAWAARDPVAAQRWALGLPRGEMRDLVLGQIVSRFSRPDFRLEIDSEIIDAFESDEARAAAERMSERAL